MHYDLHAPSPTGEDSIPSSYTLEHVLNQLIQ
jgi:hypothetical protein